MEIVRDLLVFIGAMFAMSIVLIVVVSNLPDQNPLKRILTALSRLARLFWPARWPFPSSQFRDSMYFMIWRCQSHSSGIGSRFSVVPYDLQQHHAVHLQVTGGSVLGGANEKDARPVLPSWGLNTPRMMSA
jgi:hypothetical protein